MIKENKDKIAINLKKSKWMLESIYKMVEEDHYCVNVSQQINAVIWLLRNVNNMLLENHLKTCAVEKFQNGTIDDIDSFVAELVRVWDVGTRK